ncbi:MAG: head GIN domain-containing protein [Burkholderiaceae bacterium]
MKATENLVPRKPGSTLSSRIAKLAGHACLLLVALVALIPTAAAAADVVSEARPLGPFRTVRLIGSADLVLTQSDTPSLVAEGDKDVVRYLKSEIRGDELMLSYEPKGSNGWWRSDSKGPRFLLSTKTLDRVSTSGSGDIRSRSFTLPGDFEIVVAGSSDIRFDALAARKLLVRISGSGDVTLSGGVLEQNVRIAGSGDYDGAALQSASATISIGGSGDATLWARDSLSVKIAGSGDVKYYGRPALAKSIAGSGSVTGLGDRP